MTNSFHPINECSVSRAINASGAVKQIALNTVLGKALYFTTISVTQTVWRQKDTVNMPDMAKYQNDIITEESIKKPITSKAKFISM